ncbi:hypothetical protein [Bdellovibrio sp. BCCA]|uniref:hypothetical protein n=1 Tax=Bdellovibrio sp. BCCA TaxID=3136281 RepID=UPI0030F238AF
MGDSLNFSNNLRILKEHLEKNGLTIPPDHHFARAYAKPVTGDWTWSVFVVSKKTGKRFILGSGDPLKTLAKKKCVLEFTWEIKGHYINVEDISHLKNVDRKKCLSLIPADI